MSFTPRLIHLTLPDGQALALTVNFIESFGGLERGDPPRSMCALTMKSGRVHLVLETYEQVVGKIQATHPKHPLSVSSSSTTKE